MSVALNSKIDNRSSSVSAGVPGPKRIAGDESGVPLTQILRGVESMCGSNAADSVALPLIVVHTVDVFGAGVRRVGWIFNSGYEVGGGWEAKFLIISL